MEIIGRKGGGLPRNYAENSSWLNPAPWRAVQSARAAYVESMRLETDSLEAIEVSIPVNSPRLSRRERRRFGRHR